MNSSNDIQGLSLYNAARAMGVTFANETVPTDKFVSTNGLRFHYLDWGSQDSPQVVALHGFAQTCHAWDFVALSLCDRYHIIALDQRGHGDSDWAPSGDYSPDAQEQDIEAIVETLDLRNIILVGLSMGGRNAFTYASKHPDRVKALVIVDAAPETQRSGSKNIHQFVQQNDELDSVADFVDRIQKYNPRRPVDQIWGSIQHNMKQLPNGKWTWKYDKLLRSPERRIKSDTQETARLWSYVKSLKCPTLVVRGSESDVIGLEAAETMDRRIPNSELVTVEKAGHLVMGDNPAGFERVISEFLAKL